jgi:predicted membrane channel-forming protein YqfA (hemolysin III family)
MFFPNASGDGLDTPVSAEECTYDDYKLCRNDTLYAEGGERPYWRGWYHKYFALLFVVSAFLLWHRAETGTEMLATAIFATFNTIAFTTSYMYHCVDWAPLHEVRS